MQHLVEHHSVHSAEELNAEGGVFQHQGDYEAARLHYLAALCTRPDYYPALANMVRMCCQQRHFAAAASWARRALALAPHDYRLWNDLGQILMRLGRLDKAADCFWQTARGAPDDAVTWRNKALLSYRLGDFDSALTAVNAALAITPDSEITRNERALIMMAQGEAMSEALAEYEYRWFELIHLDPWDLRLPEWKGESLVGKHILFHSEQGFGDAIMMSRLARNLAATAARVTMALPPGLPRLYEFQAWDRVEVVQLDAIPAEATFDYHTPMFSAWRHLGLGRNIDSAPYLRAPGGRFDLDTRFNVGICWASGKWNIDSAARRCVPLTLFAPLAAHPGVRLWSLQKGDDEADLYEQGMEGMVEDTSRILRDWCDTAALVAQLDLVIAVDTAVSHLAGALGKPVWMLSPFTRCWRWWDIGRGNTGAPWYSSMRIYPQNAPLSWDDTMLDLGRDFANLMDARTFREAAE